MYNRIKKSITDSQSHNLVRKVHETIDVTNEHVRELSMIWDILSALDIAVCDHCQQEWFFAKHPDGLGPRGDVRGLLVWGGACCAKCLDRLYEKTQHITDPEELEDVYQSVALWLLRYRCHMNQTVWAEDPNIKNIMQLHVSRS